jgi:hypothetical protein
MSSKPSNNLIALACIVFCVGLTVFIFAESRTDPGLRMAALVSSTSVAAALIAIASTMLTGKDVTKSPDPNDVPPGTVIKDSTTTQIPPVSDSSTFNKEN